MSVLMNGGFCFVALKGVTIFSGPYAIELCICPIKSGEILQDSRSRVRAIRQNGQCLGHVRLHRILTKKRNRDFRKKEIS